MATKTKAKPLGFPELAKTLGCTIEDVAIAIAQGVK